jgi:hypothetical protein
MDPSSGPLAGMVADPRAPCQRARRPARLDARAGRVIPRSDAGRAAARAGGPEALERGRGAMDERQPQAMEAFLTAEATRRYGAERAGALAAELRALAADLAAVAAAEVPEDAEPAWHLREEEAR